MDVLYLTHPSFHSHDTGTFHPERPARLDAVERGVTESGLSVVRIEAPAATESVLELVHPAAYIESIRRFCSAGGGALDPDTVACPATWEAARHAAGAGVEAIDRLRSTGSDTTAFCAVRPPGHHALASQAMGFCIFNNIAIAARKLRGEGERVAIVDWDVHHGNGTQDLVGEDPEILYASLHQHPFYPGGGYVGEDGGPTAAGTVINVPLPAGTAGDVYRAAFTRLVLPVLAEFRPDWVLVSAGYDAHEEDPLAELRLIAADYQTMARGITGLVPANRVVVFLEGGYHLHAIAASVSATLRGLAGQDTDIEPRRSPSVSWEALDDAVESASAYWTLDRR